MTHQGTTPGRERRAIYAAAVFCLALGGLAARAQAPADPKSAPVVDGTPASPMKPPSTPPVVDSATEASPASGTAHGVYIAVHQEIDVRLGQAADSAHVRNGDMLSATLTAPVKTSDGKSLPAGTRVGVTVVAVAAAGKLQSRGELTLQVTHVGAVAVISDELTFFGKEGHKDLPDSAPAKGTEAGVAANTTLRFHVPPLPR